MKKLSFFGKRPRTLTINRYETLAIADLKVHIKMLSFTFLEKQLWLKGVYFLYLLKFVHLKAEN